MPGLHIGRKYIFALIGTAIAYGCSAESDTQQAPAPPLRAPAPAVSQATTPAVPLAIEAPREMEPTAAQAACGVQGLEVKGLMYSPGGELLPHPCQPYHPTLNNPYAVRCIDAWDWYDTGYPGDEYCILPPTPGEGIQLGAHPQGPDWYDQVSAGDMSGYRNLDQDWLVAAGEESESNYVTTTPNAEPFDYYRYHVRARTGMHHMIPWAGPRDSITQPLETWSVQSPATLGLPSREQSAVPGGQRLDDNVPSGLTQPVDDRGLHSRLLADQALVYNFHHFNPSDDVVLKEAWQNLWFEDQPTRRAQDIFGMPITQPLEIFATPGQTVDHHFWFDVTEDVRVVTLFAHRHAWTTNFSVWVERLAGGPPEPVYQSFDWYDQPTFRYDGDTENPPIDTVRGLDGAYSGRLELAPGDRLHYNCHIEFTDQRATEVGAPLPHELGLLTFSNRALEGEMCVLFGSATGGSWSAVRDPLGQVPAFASQH